MSAFSIRKTVYYIGAALTGAILIVFTLSVIKLSAAPAVSGQTPNETGYIDIYRDYLGSFGWETEKTPLEITQVIIPYEFGDTYNQYNEIQKEQNFDLLPYRGKAAVKYVFSVTNYPGAEGDEGIRATLLTYNGNIIGGDICSVSINGFMHGFNGDNG